MRYYFAKKDPNFDEKAMDILEVLEFATALGDEKNPRAGTGQELTQARTCNGAETSKPDCSSILITKEACHERYEREKKNECWQSPMPIPTAEEIKRLKRAESGKKGAQTRYKNSEKKRLLLKSKWTWPNDKAELFAITDPIEFAEKARDLKKKWSIGATDEKPNVQILGSLAPELQPIPRRYPGVAKDPHYRKCGTVDIFLWMDLVHGKTLIDTAKVHNENEFIMWLAKIRLEVSLVMTIILILDNHSVHLTPLVIRYCEENRIQLVFTPVHASWLDPAENGFSIIERTILRGERIGSMEELRHQLKRLERQRNLCQKRYRWGYLPSHFIENSMAAA